MKRAFALIFAVLSLAVIPKARSQSSAPAANPAAPLRVAMAGLAHGHAEGLFTRVKDRRDIQIVGVAEPDRKLIMVMAQKMATDRNHRASAEN